MNKETEQSEVHVKVRSYGLTELGLLYNPSLQPDSAAKAIKRWIAFNKDLTTALQQSGWRKRSAQVYTATDATDFQVSGRALRIEN
ncbi:MAG: DUF4248 domain-containing protein [Parabacteroides sp.]